MNGEMANIIEKKSRAFKHCDKILKQIEEKGTVEIKVGATGVTLPCTKGDSLHNLVISIRHKLAYELGSLDVSMRTDVKAMMEPIIKAASKRMAVAPVGACDSAICEYCGEEYTKDNSRQKYCKKCAKERLKEYKRAYYLSHKK